MIQTNELFRIDGVSENLWAAEGMLGTFEKLSLYDSPDTVGRRKNFQGDIDVSGLPEDIVPYEVSEIPAHATDKESSYDAVTPPKRLKPESPEL
jgi:hypothetical protein